MHVIFAKMILNAKITMWTGQEEIKEETCLISWHIDWQQAPQRTYRVEMKYGECICPLSWSALCNFVRDGRYSGREGGSAPPTLTSLG